MAIDIYIFEYLDNAFTTEELEEIDDKPFVLFTTGFILHENEDYYVVVSTGGKYRKKKPDNMNYILKDAVKFKEKIYTIKNGTIPKGNNDNHYNIAQLIKKEKN